MPHEYSATFFDYIEQGSIRSARAIVGPLAGQLKPASVLDVGCGRGLWLREWKNAGVERVFGIDGHYVDRLCIAADEFKAVDLSLPFDLGQRFDLVMSVEVAEHLPPASAQGFVRSLIAHGDCILFSAATVGQGGTDHINERPLGYWRGLFAAEGYECFDCARPLVADDPSIEPWYRYNTLLYVHESRVAGLPQAIKATHVLHSAPLRDYESAGWKCRKLVLRAMPRPVVTWLALKNAAMQARRAKAR